jgi:Double zinc ribbon
MRVRTTARGESCRDRTGTRQRRQGRRRARRSCNSQPRMTEAWTFRSPGSWPSTGQVGAAGAVRLIDSSPPKKLGSAHSHQGGSGVRCPRCQQENRPQAKFCEECAAPLVRTCPKCGPQASPSAKFCSECARPLSTEAAPQRRFASPDVSTPKHLADRILTSRAALEGERKQVTVLFADMKDRWNMRRSRGCAEGCMLG